VVFVLVVVLDLAHTVPHETALALDLGATHDDVRDLVVRYTGDGQLAREAHRHYPSGAPSRVTDTIDLVPGPYVVELELDFADGHVEHREGRFDAPGEGLVVVSWRD
jgi:hypothetical protein